jgi:hypothetical protein
MFSPAQGGLEAMAEYIIKMMEHRSGLSRERILKQLSSEYGGDVSARLAEFQKIAVAKGYEAGTTLVEVMSKTLPIAAPGLFGKRK